MSRERKGGLVFFAIMLAAAFTPEDSFLYPVVGIALVVVILAFLASLLRP